MTFDERMAELGVETNDILPSNEHCNNLYEKFFASAERICKEMGEECDLEMLLSYLIIAIAKRDGIIDRMETRIINLTGERDFLAKRLSDMGCGCGICLYVAQPADGIPCKDCYAPPKEKYFVFSGVPEDWSVDNA